jgi:hypothetical protein
MLSFRFGTKLADTQSELIDLLLGGHLTKARNKGKWLKRYNVWDHMARTLAPNNLSIRSAALEYILYNNEEALATCKKLILKLMVRDDAGNYPLWVEGYSYWVYTRDALEHIGDNDVGRTISEINNSFVLLGHHYIENRIEKFTPPPFGDCRALGMKLTPYQKTLELPTDINHPLVVVHRNGLNRTRYLHNTYTIGGNTHTEDEIGIITYEGEPTFEEHDYYTGYPTKYKNVFVEWLDIIGRMIKS